jgi:hypothetical protein
MLRLPECDCAPGHFITGTVPGRPHAAEGPETAARAAGWRPEAGSREYRGGAHPGGTLGFGVAAPPARGEAGFTLAPPHGGPGV